MLSRRDTLKRLSAAVPGLSLGALAAVQSLAATPAQAQGVTAAAGRWSIPFGVCVRDEPLAGEQDYRAALTRHCALLVSEGAMKWDVVRPTPDAFAFEQGDRHLRFATENRMGFRGHTLVWHGGMPSWAERMTSPAEAERQMVRHIEAMVGRYRGRIPSWDVVNEPIAERPRGRETLRETMWSRTLGPGYVALALRTAAQADPAARLIINEYDIEFAGDIYRRKREALLQMITELRQRGVPLHGVGLQAHLRGELQIDHDGVAAFCSQVRAMGLDILVTEMDVIDHLLPGPSDLRDMMTAARVHDFLSAVFAGARPTAVMTWGITDRHTWVPIWFRRGDGTANRPLPLDDAYRPKLMYRVIEHFCRRSA